MKEAARNWLLYIAKTVPKDTGFLLGAFTPLAEMLNVKILTVKSGRSVFAGLKQARGLTGLKQELTQARMERERRLRFLKTVRAQNKAREKERDSERAGDAGLGTESAGLNRRENYLQNQKAYFERRLLKKRFKKNVRIYKQLKVKIAKLEIAVRKLRARRINYRALQEHGSTGRSRYRTVEVATNYTNAERMKARLAKRPLPATVKVRQRILPGDPDATRAVYRKHYYPGAGQPRGPIKTPTSGFRYATSPSEIFVEGTQPPAFVKGSAFEEFGQDGKNITLKNLKGHVQGDPTKLTYKFTYNVDITYYKIMDMLGRYKTKSGKTMRPPGTPWFSQRYAGMAYQRYLEQVLPKRLPYFTDYLVKFKSTLKNNSFTRGFK